MFFWLASFLVRHVCTQKRRDMPQMDRFGTQTDRLGSAQERTLEGLVSFVTKMGVSKPGEALDR